jgi:hypothetical protein
LENYESTILPIDMSVALVPRAPVADLTDEDWEEICDYNYYYYYYANGDYSEYDYYFQNMFNYEQDRLSEVRPVKLFSLA